MQSERAALRLGLKLWCDRHVTAGAAELLIERWNAIKSVNLPGLNRELKELGATFAREARTGLDLVVRRVAVREIADAVRRRERCRRVPIKRPRLQQPRADGQ